MGLLADQHDGHGPFAPQREIEGHAAQHRDHDVKDLRGYAGQVDTINRCIVWGYQRDSENNISQKKILITLSVSVTQYKSYTAIVREIISVTPDVYGYWEAELIENSNMIEDAYYIIDTIERVFRVLVPDEVSKNIYDLSEV